MRVAATPTSIDLLCANTRTHYDVAPALRKGGARHDSLRDAARIELGLRAFLEEGGFKGFTDHLRGSARPASSCPASPSSG